MMSSPDHHISYLDRNNIDIGKWDLCIQKATNGLIYARSFYLDIMAKNWSALILNDYEAVMPLTWSQKYGVSYLYQPAFTAQLGLFSSGQLDIKIFENFLLQLSSHFRFCEIHLNYSNPPLDNPVCANYILDLDKPYPELRKNYKKRLVENLQESSLFELQYVRSTDYHNTIRLFKNEYGKRFSHTRRSDYQHFEILCARLQEGNMIFAREVRDKEGVILNASIFFSDENRIYNMMSVTPAEGRKKRAHFYLLDQLILEFSSNKLVLDFEGSEIPGIAEFYRKFGTVNQPYPFFKFNRLPFPFRYFK
jgi:hypothetical protein